MSTIADPSAALRRIAEELRVVAPDRFVHMSAMPEESHDARRVDGQRPADLDDGFSSIPFRGPSWAVVPSLSTFVYTTYYLGNTSAEARARAAEISTGIVMREDPVFGVELRQANLGAGVVEDGWRIVGSRDGGTLVRKDCITLLAHDDDIVRRSETDDGVSIRFPNERPYAYPQYYLAVGDGGVPGHAPDAPLTRVYFRVDAIGAPRLLSALTSTLGLKLSRFAVKVLNHPASYSRSDAVVAYVPRDELAIAMRMLPEVVAVVAGHLSDPVPLCTMRVEPGIGVAEDPVSGDVRFSFGQHRSMLIARGLASAFQGRAEDTEARLSFILREFVAADIDPAHPYCRRSSVEWFQRQLP